MPANTFSGCLGAIVSTSLGRDTANGRSNNPLTRLNIVEFAPVPRASDNTATNVNAGSFQNMRTA